MAHVLTSLSFPFLQNITPSLLPCRGLKRIENNTWRSLDIDPQFTVISQLFSILSGWISVRVSIDSESIVMPKLYCDFGEGYSEMGAVTMYQVDEGIYQAELMLPKVLANLRFDPTDEASIFTISAFQIRAHSELLHTIHQFISIMKHDYSSNIDTLRIFKKSYARYKKHHWVGMLERLEKEYKRLHPFRIQRATSVHIDYLNWIRKNEKKYGHEIFDKNLFDHTPLISIVMPVYNTPVEYLKKAIDSVITQSYPYWELCIADDASSDTDTIRLLTKYTKKDDRIHVVFRNINGNISLASNAALAMAQGEYVAFLDHDDMLASNALLEVIKVINSRTDTKFIYSDEDKIDERGRRFSPHFKSGWNPDMFLSHNYISHLSIIQKSLLDKVGNFRVGYEGSQDYDLFLRVLDQLSSFEIVHIEKILYHWRASEGSTAFNAEAKSHTTAAGLKALKDYFSTKNEMVNVVEGLLPNTYKVIYPIVHEPLVTLIIPTRDNYKILFLCIKSILEKTSYKNYEIIIVDNQTTDLKTLAYLEDLVQTYSSIRIIKYDKTFNYSAINNFAVTYANGDIVGLINNDVEIISDYWLTEMVEHALRPEIGVVGAKLYYDDDTIQHAGVILGIGGVAGHSHKNYKKNDHGYFSRLKVIQNYSAVTGACLVVRKILFEEVAGLNEEYLSVAFNDVDFCLKLQEKGYRTLWTPYVELYHHESITRGEEDDMIKRARFNAEVNYMKKRWGERLQKDSYYNKNLTLMHENFSIKEDTVNAL